MIQESSAVTPGKHMTVNWPEQRVVLEKRKQCEEK
jgi:hypothetical protein